MKVKFISYFDVFQLIKILCFRRKYDKIYYFDISKTGKMLLDVLKLSGHIEHFAFSLAKIGNELGQNRKIKIWDQDVPYICNAIEANLLDKSPFIRKFGEKVNHGKVIFYFKKLIVTGSFYIGYIKHFFIYWPVKVYGVS